MESAPAKTLGRSRRRRHFANASRRRNYTRGMRDCGTCNGSGVGIISKARCHACGGSGDLVDAIRRLG